MIRVALAIDVPDWHARAMRTAFAEAGAEAVPLRLADCWFETGRGGGVALPGFERGLPDAMFVRAIAGGSFEEVTRRLGVLHALRELGVPVWNDARAIERCVDKSMTSFLLAAAGLPTPPTWVVEGEAAARAVALRELPAGPLVGKPLFGSQGRGLRLVARIEDLPPPEAVQGVYYLQRFVAPSGPGYADHRLLVAGGAVLAAMTRRHRSWITNLWQGAAPEKLVADPELVRLALAASETVGADYAGVDLLRGADGVVQVIEVNSMPGWRGLQKVADAPIARGLATALLSRLR
ncbi:MAG TPA: RimK family alpha-L-glutamate ligase [Acetobacteraceae bacterium]|nr:RimK family alpha-L-glutamate ligase [Acetobacteraceae bacterium]